MTKRFMKRVQLSNSVVVLRVVSDDLGAVNATAQFASATDETARHDLTAASVMILRSVQEDFVGLLQRLK